MTGISYRSIIEEKYDPSQVADIVTMIDILAKERAAQLGVPVSDAAYEFAAAVLCVILDPVKSDAYKRGVEEVHATFQGVAASPEVQMAFRDSLSEGLLKADDPREVFDTSIMTLFHLPALLRF